MSSCDHKECINGEVCQPAVPEIVEKKIPKIQYVSVTLADGRKGVFAGPELIPNAELLLAPPRLVSIDFSQPMDYPKPPVVEPTVEVKEEPKIESKLEDSPQT